jgi:uncharacterized protein (DUF2336 family)
MLIDELTTLARDNNADKRRELLRRISDMFVESAGAHSNLENELFGDVMARVVNSVEEVARVELADKLAPQDLAPHEIIVKLARDSGMVAKSVLKTSKVLTDADLIEIASQKSEGHLVAIAARKGVSEAVTDVLVNKGSDLVLETVAGNLTAHVSTTSFTQMAHRASASQALQTAMVSRKDLPPAALEELVPLLSQELTWRLMERGYNLEAQLPDVLVAQLRARLAGVVNEKSREQRDVKVMIADIRDGRQTLADTVIMLAKYDRAYDLAEVMANMLDIDVKSAIGAILGEKTDPLIVLLRAVDLGLEPFDAMLQLRSKRMRRVIRMTSKLKSSYMGTSQEYAQRALRFHKVRSAASS